jgi:hypothetical protein
MTASACFGPRKSLTPSDIGPLRTNDVHHVQLRGNGPGFPPKASCEVAFKRKAGPRRFFASILAFPRIRADMEFIRNSNVIGRTSENCWNRPCDGFQGTEAPLDSCTVMAAVVSRLSDNVT